MHSGTMRVILRDLGPGILPDYGRFEPYRDPQLGTQRPGMQTLPLLALTSWEFGQPFPLSGPPFLLCKIMGMNLDVLDLLQH